MAPVISYSISNVSLIPGTVIKARKNYCSTRLGLSRRSAINTLSPQSYLLPLSTSFRLFPPYSRGCFLHNRSRVQLLSATGTDVAVEEPGSPVVAEDSTGASQISSEEGETKSDASSTSAEPKRTRPVRKSEMPPVKDEELVPNATFTGKVRSIQPFGAFIDFGAFTDGLVHVSRLSDSYVKDVGSVVSVGQEVEVRLVEANLETGRISLTMRDSDDPSKVQQQKDAPASSDKAGPGRRNASKPGQKRGDSKKVSKFVKGQDLEGTVKNMNRAGAFISLPEGEEGFLPVAEELDEGFENVTGETLLQVGQEVSVRVLRISRGQVTLTMKKEENVQKSDVQLSQGVIHTATNPFVLAFRQNKDIAAFLDEREKIEKTIEEPAASKVSEELEGKASQSETVPDNLEEKDQQVSNNEEAIDASVVDEKVDIDKASSKEVEAGASALEAQTAENTEAVSEILAPEVGVSTGDPVVEEVSSVNGAGSDGKPD